MKNSTEASSGKLVRNLVILALLGGVVGLSLWTLSLKRDQETLAAKRTSGPVPAEIDVVPAPVREPLPVVESPAQVTISPATSTEAKTPANPMAAAMQQMMNSPAIRERMLTRMEGQYSDAFERFAFDPTQRRRFAELMFEVATAPSMTDAVTKMMSGGGTAEEREAMNKERKEVGRAIEARVQDFFSQEFPANPAMFAEFTAFTDRSSDRTQVAAMQSGLTQSGESLSATQSDQLVEILFEERRNGRPAASGQPADPAGATSAEGEEARLRRLDLTNERVIERASAFLTPAQLVALREQQARARQTSQAGAATARALFGAGQPAAK